MAEASIAVAEKQFSCPICLDLLKDPVTIPCGHSYCMSCITNCWNQDDQRGDYSCPQCRQTFTPRPALNKNVVFAEMVEKLRMTKLQKAQPDLSYARPGDVECDVCVGRKRKAVKSCLLCLESYCQTHFERHEKFRSGKRHKVTDATGRLKQMICSKHDRLLEVFCRTDQQCICLLCTMDKQHTNHDIVSAETGRTEKQKQVGEMQEKFQQIIQERQKELQKLEEVIKIQKVSAQTAVKDIEKIFTKLIRSIERSRSEVVQMIRDQEKTAVSRAEGHLEKLELEIEDLRRRVVELELLLNTDDDIHFLQTFQSLSVPPASRDSINANSLLSYDDLSLSVSMLRGKTDYLCKKAMDDIFGKVVAYVEIVTPPALRTRDEFLQYSCQLTLDSNTAHRYLSLTEGNQVATCIGADQRYPDHPDRFHDFSQVLCKKGVIELCYWEIEWSGKSGVGISVSYKNISRKGQGNDCVFGYNDQSWRLSLSDSRCTFRHDQKEIQLPVVSSSPRIGVFVDHRAGILSFFSVSNKMTLIHRVQTTFTQPLLPGFAINLGSTVKLYGLP